MKIKDKSDVRTLQSKRERDFWYLQYCKNESLNFPIDQFLIPSKYSLCQSSLRLTRIGACILILDFPKLSVAV